MTRSTANSGYLDPDYFFNEELFGSAPQSPVPSVAPAPSAAPAPAPGYTPQLSTPLDALGKTFETWTFDPNNFGQEKGSASQQIAELVASTPGLAESLGLSAADFNLGNAPGQFSFNQREFTPSVSQRAMDALSGLTLNRTGAEGLEDGRSQVLRDAQGNVLYSSDPYSYDPNAKLATIAPMALAAIPGLQGVAASLGSSLGASGLGASMLGTGLMNAGMAGVTGGDPLKAGLLGAAGAGIAPLTSAAGSAVSSAVGGGTLGSALGGAASGALNTLAKGALTGNLSTESLLAGALSGGAGAGVNSAVGGGDLGKLLGGVAGSTVGGLASGADFGDSLQNALVKALPSVLSSLGNTSQSPAASAQPAEPQQESSANYSLSSGPGSFGSLQGGVDDLFPSSPAPSPNYFSADDMWPSTSLEPGALANQYLDDLWGPEQEYQASATAPAPSPSYFSTDDMWTPTSPSPIASQPSIEQLLSQGDQPMYDDYDFAYDDLFDPSYSLADLVSPTGSGLNASDFNWGGSGFDLNDISSNFGSTGQGLDPSDFNWGGGTSTSGISHTGGTSGSGMNVSQDVADLLGPQPTGTSGGTSSTSGGSSSNSAALNLLNKLFGSNMSQADLTGYAQLGTGLLGLLDALNKNTGGGGGAMSPTDLQQMVGGGQNAMSEAHKASQQKFFTSPLTKYTPPTAAQAMQRYGVNPAAPTYKTYARGGGVTGGSASCGCLNRINQDLHKMAAGGRYVGPSHGPGGGQEDTVDARLSVGEYVFDADVVSALGDGSNEEGARLLDEMREAIRAHKRSAPSDKIPPKAHAPLHYLRGK